MVEIASRKVVGVEALIRWRHPVRGLLNPAHFIPIAEEAGSITALDRWVLEEACRQTLAWNNGRANGRRVSVSVNFSPRHFPQSDCAAVVQTVLAKTGLKGDLLSIEITESALIENIESSIDTIRSLNQLGVEVHLDDYGTGYSSLVHLSRLPVSHLKIDRAFVRSMGTSPRDAGIVQSTVALAHSLGMKAIAEGVETPEQLDQLKGFGCEVAQGYYLHPPLEKRKLDELLAA
jgi:EAL domain-containing protein (putative c-di-GMP-specific phosphodiesterase class I)